MRRAIALAAAVVGLVATACGPTATEAPSRRANDPITTTHPPPLDGTVLQFAQEFWHSGFHVELDGAEVFTTETMLTHRISHWLTLRGNFENLGEDIATFDPEMAIEALGISYVKRRGRPPQILPESSARGELTFLIPEDLDLDASDLVIGAAGESRARIPLGSGGPAVRLEPTDVAISGQVALELIDFTFTGASLRYDLPDRHSQLESGKRALTLHFDVTSRNPRDTRISADDIVLIVPDGSTVAPAAAELGAVPGGDEGVTTADRLVSFVVDEIPSGDFTLQVNLDASFASEDGAAEATFEFSL